MRPIFRIARKSNPEPSRTAEFWDRFFGFAASKAPMQPDAQALPLPTNTTVKSLRCINCDAEFASVYDMEIHLIEEKANGWQAECLVPLETEIEDWFEDPDFWEWWIEVAQSLYARKRVVFIWNEEQ